MTTTSPSTSATVAKTKYQVTSGLLIPLAGALLVCTAIPYPISDIGFLRLSVDKSSSRCRLLRDAFSGNHFASTGAANAGGVDEER